MVMDNTASAPSSNGSFLSVRDAVAQTGLTEGQVRYALKKGLLGEPSTIGSNGRSVIGVDAAALKAYAEAREIGVKPSEFSEHMEILTARLQASTANDNNNPNALGTAPANSFGTSLEVALSNFDLERIVAEEPSTPETGAPVEVRDEVTTQLPPVQETVAVTAYDPTEKNADPDASTGQSGLIYNLGAPDIVPENLLYGDPTKKDLTTASAIQLEHAPFDQDHTTYHTASMGVGSGLVAAAAAARAMKSQKGRVLTKVLGGIAVVAIAVNLTISGLTFLKSDEPANDNTGPNGLDIAPMRASALPIDGDALPTHHDLTADNAHTPNEGFGLPGFTADGFDMSVFLEEAPDTTFSPNAGIGADGEFSLAQFGSDNAAEVELAGTDGTLFINAERGEAILAARAAKEARLAQEKAAAEERAAQITAYETDHNLSNLQVAADSVTFSKNGFGFTFTPDAVSVTPPEQTDAFTEAGVFGGPNGFEMSGVYNLIIRANATMNIYNSNLAAKTEAEAAARVATLKERLAQAAKAKAAALAAANVGNSADAGAGAGTNPDPNTGVTPPPAPVVAAVGNSSSDITLSGTLSPNAGAVINPKTADITPFSAGSLIEINASKPLNDAWVVNGYTGLDVTSSDSRVANGFGLGDTGLQFEKTDGDVVHTVDLGYQVIQTLPGFNLNRADTLADDVTGNAVTTATAGNVIRLGYNYHDGDVRKGPFNTHDLSIGVFANTNTGTSDVYENNHGYGQWGFEGTFVGTTDFKNGDKGTLTAGFRRIQHGDRTAYTYTENRTETGTKDVEVEKKETIFVEHLPTATPDFSALQHGTLSNITLVDPGGQIQVDPVTGEVFFTLARSSALDTFDVLTKVPFTNTYTDTFNVKAQGETHVFGAYTYTDEAAFGNDRLTATYFGHLAYGSNVDGDPRNDGAYGGAAARLGFQYSDKTTVNGGVSYIFNNAYHGGDLQYGTIDAGITHQVNDNLSVGGKASYTTGDVEGWRVGAFATYSF